jgi:hypothetical protein
MPTTKPPLKEAELVTFTGDFLHTLQTKPAGTFPVDAARIAEYVTTRNNFLAAYATASNPNTRTKPSVEAKNVAKAKLIRSTRSIIDVCQSWPQMTNELRFELGINERGKKPEPGPIPGKPIVKVVAIDERDVTITIESSKGVRAKPKGVNGASVMVAYGAKPESIQGWTFKELVGKSKATITLDAVETACTVWITAFWFNGRKQTGQAATPVSVNLSEIDVVPATGNMKIKKAA